MPIQVVWDNDARTAIRYILTNRWTWEEVRAAEAEAFALDATTDHPFVTIIDLTDAKTVPAGSFFTEGRQLMSRKPAHAHNTMVVVGAMGLFQTLYKALHRLYGKRYEDTVVFVPTLEQARQLVDEILAAP